MASYDHRLGRFSASSRRGYSSLTVHLLAPKNLCSKDFELSKDTPFFCDLGCPVGASERGCDRPREYRNDELQIGFFNFHKHIPHAEQDNIPLCRFCFAKFTLRDLRGLCDPFLPCVTKTCHSKYNCCQSSHIQFSG